jgi:hypothetical protein
MKKVAYSVVVAVISLCIGYGIYPILNTNEHSSSQLIDIVNSDDHILIEKTSTPKILTTSQQNQQITPAPKIAQNIEQEIEIKTSAPDAANIIKTNKTNAELSEPDAPAIKELNNWAISHKALLGQTILENVPPLFADAMTDMISKDNDFLNKPKVIQESQLDENWAYIMEQELRNLINQNPASADFNLLLLTCKQLTCEILGLENAKNAWRKIYFGLLQTAPLIKLPNGESRFKNINFSENNIAYVYSQLKFKPNENNN